jgi:accessory gene regulator protein AgrB
LPWYVLHFACVVPLFVVMLVVILPFGAIFMAVYHLLSEFASGLHYRHYRQCPLTSLVCLKIFFWLSQVVFVEATEARHAFKKLLYTRYK